MTDRFARVHIPAGRDLIADVSDEWFSQSDMEGVFGSHAALYQHTEEGVTLPHLRLSRMVP